MYEIHMQKMKVGAPSLSLVGVTPRSVMEPTGNYEVFTAPDWERAAALARELENSTPYSLDNIVEVPDGTLPRRRKYTLTPMEQDAIADRRLRALIQKHAEVSATA
jgi:hypothetical protein